MDTVTLTEKKLISSFFSHSGHLVKARRKVLRRSVLENGLERPMYIHKMDGPSKNIMPLALTAKKKKIESVQTFVLALQSKTYRGFTVGIYFMSPDTCHKMFGTVHYCIK